MEWRASHILVKDKALATELLKKAKQGASFEALARQHSTCPSKSSGGDLGWFGPGKMVAAFEQACKRLPVNSAQKHKVRIGGNRKWLFGKAEKITVH